MRGGITSFPNTFIIGLHEGTQRNRVDGWTLIIQGNSPKAVGVLGGDIRSSAAIKFDVYDLRRGIG
jgi:hypothetical protein